MEEMGKSTLEAVLALIQNTFGGFEQILTALQKVEVKTTDIDLSSFGVSLTTFFFLIQMFAEMSNFRFERLEDAVRLGLKLVVAKVIIENSSAITGVIYNAFFKPYGIERIKTALGSWKSDFLTVTKGTIDGGLLGVNFLFEATILLIAWLIIMALLIKMVAQIAGILFDIAVHQVIAPVALSTLCNDTAKSTGIAFIKSYSATCLNCLVIAILFSAMSPLYEQLSEIHKKFFESSTEVISSTFLIDALTLMAPIICMIVLSTAVSRSSDMTKRMLGA